MVFAVCGIPGPVTPFVSGQSEPRGLCESWESPAVRLWLGACPRSPLCFRRRGFLSVVRLVGRPRRRSGDPVWLTRRPGRWTGRPRWRLVRTAESRLGRHDHAFRTGTLRVDRARTQDALNHIRRKSVDRTGLRTGNITERYQQNQQSQSTHRKRHLRRVRTSHCFSHACASLASLFLLKVVLSALLSR